MSQFKLEWKTDEELRAMSEEQLNAYVYDQCRKQFNVTGSVLPPQCCVRCSGCPLKALVEGVLNHNC